jgi:hypothetical protein
MKRLAFVMLVAMTGMTCVSGCTLDTPAYSAKERFQQIGRNMYFDGEAFNDDVDHALLLRPSNQNTIWNVYHRD